MRAVDRDETPVHGRNAHEHSDRLSAEPIENLARVEPRQEDGARPCVKGPLQSHEESVHVKEWKSVQENVALTPPPGLVKGSGQGGEVPLCDHCALWLARGAGRVTEQGNLVRAPPGFNYIKRLSEKKRHVQFFLLPLLEISSGRPEKGLPPGGVPGGRAGFLTQEEADICVLEEISRFFCRVSRVQGNENCPIEQACEIIQDGFDGRHHLDGDAVPGPDVVPLVPTRCSLDSFEYLSVAVLRFRENQGHPVSLGRENPCQMFRQGECFVGRCAHPNRFPRLGSRGFF